LSRYDGGLLIGNPLQPLIGHQRHFLLRSSLSDLRLEFFRIQLDERSRAFDNLPILKMNPANDARDLGSHRDRGDCSSVPTAWTDSVIELTTTGATSTQTGWSDAGVAVEDSPGV
jgi:hypothetical protein